MTSRVQCVDTLYSAQSWRGFPTSTCLPRRYIYETTINTGQAVCGKFSLLPRLVVAALWSSGHADRLITTSCMLRFL